MADTHEEQLLSDVLRGIAREDALLDGAHLEARVLTAAVDAGLTDLAGATAPTSSVAGSTPVSFGETRRSLGEDSQAAATYSATYLKVAAAVAAVLVPTIVWMAITPTRDLVTAKSDTREVAARPAASMTLSTLPTPSTPSAPTTLSTVPPATTLSTSPTPATSAAPQTLSTLPTLSTLAMSATLPPDASADFVPLMPIAEQEITGSFQIVRVQMPRASLGRLRSPLERPDELVEADVLLGADGMARAIRVSTASSLYPRRSR